MQKLMYSVYDQKAKIFSNPFWSVNNATALRDFERACNDAGSDLYRFPNDFSLYHLGSFDDCTGSITINPEPIHLGSAIQFKEV